MLSRTKKIMSMVSSLHEDCESETHHGKTFFNLQPVCPYETTTDQDVAAVEGVTTTTNINNPVQHNSTITNIGVADAVNNENIDLAVPSTSAASDHNWDNESTSIFSDDVSDWEPNENEDRNETSSDDDVRKGTKLTDIKNTSNLQETSHSFIECPSEIPVSKGGTHNHVFVPEVDKSKNVRVWDKKDACLFCGKIFVKLTQHLLTSHSTEIEVINCFSSPKNTQSRTNQIRQLRNKGNYVHNYKVLLGGQGCLIVCRRPTTECKPTDFLPCPYCYGYYMSKKLYRHGKICPDKKTPSGNNEKNNNIKTLAFLLTPTAIISNKEFFEKVVTRMRVDNVTNTVRNDATLVALGTKLFHKFENTPHMISEISQKLRLVGKLVLTIREKYPHLKSVEDIVMPEAFPTLVSVVEDMYMKCKPPSPTSAMKVGQNLIKCVSILLVQCIVNGDKKKRQKLEDFKYLYEKEWSLLISSKAKTILYESKFNKPVGIPNEKDVFALNSYLVQNENELTDDDFKNCVYMNVVKTTLAHVIVFNRRRCGKVQRLTIKDYNQRQRSNTPQGEIEEILTAAEQRQNSELERVEVRGKKGKKVPILFTQKMNKCIEFILKNRENHGVHKSNQYVFACPFSQNPIRGYDSIQYAVAQSGASKEFLNSRGLRKHVSTISQLFNLNQNELDGLAEFLGHSMAVHKEYYQMPLEMVQKTQISKIFFAIEQGKVKSLTGKSLKEFGGNEAGSCKDEQRTSPIFQVNEKSNKRTLLNVVESDENLDSDETKSDKGCLKKKTRPCTGKKKPFSDEEKKILLHYFQQNISRRKTPGKKHCSEFQMKFKNFQKYNWTKVKFFVYNQWSMKTTDKD